MDTATQPHDPPPEREAGVPWRGVVRERAFAVAVLVALAGIALRLLPCCGVPDKLSLDEKLYIHNVLELERLGGPANYPDLVAGYVTEQKQAPIVLLPPTRAMYITAGWGWDMLLHPGARLALRRVAGVFSSLGLLVAMVFAWRLGGPWLGVATGALMAVSPLHLMLAHRELVDGVFAFWALLALWLLWENLRREPSMPWLCAYAAAIIGMVLTKENAFFAAVGLGGVLLVATFQPALGKVRVSTVVATAAGGLLGIGILICLAGGFAELVETYRLVVTKAEAMRFAQDSGGGPWYRYLVDLMLISPLVMIAAIGGGLRRLDRAAVFVMVFIAASGLVMVNVKNGMNVRYAAMWEMPLRYLAAGMLLRVGARAGRATVLVTAVIFACVCAVELHQYRLLFVRHDIVDPITQYLMYATGIVRPPAAP